MEQDSTHRADNRRRLAAVSVVLGVAAVAAMLYWPTLRLPLLFDDLLHIRLVKDLDLTSVWLPSERFGFYRPFVFLPLILIKSLFGYYPSLLLHTLSLAQHILNAVLVAALARRMWHRWARGLAAGLLLAAYPFAYQAIAFYGNNIYPTSTGLILFGLHTYLFAIQTHQTASPTWRIGWWAITAAIFLIGLLSHETVVLYGPLAVLVHLQLVDFQDLRSGAGGGSLATRLAARLLPALIFTALGILYVIVYQFLPTGGGPNPVTGGNAPWPKALYLLQSGVYPVAWFAHLLPNLAANLILLTGLVLTLVLTLWAARRPGNRVALLLGWGWWVLASLLLALNLPTYYIEHGPRLTYLGGVGVALLWAVLLDSLLAYPRAGPILYSTALAFIVVSSGLFVRDRLAAFAAIARPLQIIEEVMIDQSAGQGILLVNLPAWMSPARNTYAVGVEYVTLMGDHLFAEELIEENLRANHPVLAVRESDLLSDPGYPYGVHDQARKNSFEGDWAPEGSHVFVTTYGLSGPETRYRGQLLPPNGDQAVLATVGPYSLLDAQAQGCPASVRLQTTWRWSGKEATSSPTTSMFAQLLDTSGQLVSQADGPPLGLRPDLLEISNGWRIVDLRLLANETALEGGNVLIGFYDYASGTRLPAVDAAQRPLPDNAIRLPVGFCTSSTPSP